jgi:hypothetical protein
VELKVVDGQLTLGSVYRLIVVGWICSWTAFMGVVLLLLVLITLVTGEMAVNGHTVHGRIAVLARLAPMLVAAPIVIVLQGFLFGAFLTGGVWLYRLRRRLEIVAGGPVAEHPAP